MTIEEKDGTISAYRLPHQLDDWVQVSMMMSTQGLNVFPSEVEFGKINGRIYAEIL